MKFTIGNRIGQRLLTGIGIAAIAAGALCLAAPESSAATLSTKQATYAPSEAVVVQFSGFPGKGPDWITVVKASAKDNTYAEWNYVGRRSSGTMAFKGLPVGNYEARGYFNWPQGGYTVQARHAFTVKTGVGSTSAIVKTSKPVYNAGEEIVVEFSRFSGSKSDWITVVPDYYPIGKYAEWHYTGGAKSGTMKFQGLPSGEYLVRAYFNWPSGQYVVKGSYKFIVR